MIKCVIFDMAGTTVEDFDNVTRALHRAIGGSSYWMSIQQIKDLMGMDKREAIELLLTSKVDEVHKNFVEDMCLYYAAHVKEIDGTTALFKALREKGIKVALTTGFPREIANIIIEKLNWSNLVDISVTSDEVTEGRPEPYMIFRILHKLGLKRNEVVKIGDTTSDVRAGLKAGVYTYGVTTGNCTRDDFAAYKCNVVNSLEEMTRDLP